MLLNIALVFLYFAAIGAVAHRLTCRGGNLLHLALVGFLGYMLSEFCRSILGCSFGVLGIIAADIAGSVVVELIIWWIQVYLTARKIRNSNDSDENQE